MADEDKARDPKPPKLPGSPPAPASTPDKGPKQTNAGERS